MTYLTLVKRMRKLSGRKPDSTLLKLESQARRQLALLPEKNLNREKVVKPILVVREVKGASLEIESVIIVGNQAMRRVLVGSLWVIQSGSLINKEDVVEAEAPVEVMAEAVDEELPTLQQQQVNMEQLQTS